ncbi:3722_t:CDS:2 [Acaulospora colombiana]|uniref:3722_t:CDS:1 n=1 Tax=Acaulospora colombiana TaxID=27376 RepID=A0ACA9LFS9_9GLOM|nr:3722_t:CDS:2 [Acaulospora colombiana]
MNEKSANSGYRDPSCRETEGLSDYNGAKDRITEYGLDAPAARWLNWLERNNIETCPKIGSLCAKFVAWIRLNEQFLIDDKSGYNTPPMYGDYEAQRHWMEITLHIPISQWYYYDLEWWGLDYPPLTAYVSWICATFGIIFFPFLDSFEHISQVVLRMFPLQRGLYEDKVSNIWCAVNVVIKLRETFEIQSLTWISLVTTLLAVLPSCLHLGSSSNKRGLIYGLANSSLAFFMFSFQVHEKSILLPALPITLLILNEPFWGCNTNNFPLELSEVEIQITETDYNPQFLQNMLPKLDWSALVKTARKIGITSIPEVLPEALTEDLDEGFLRNLHRALLETHVQQGKMVCPNCKHVYSIRDGIPNMLLSET